MKRILLLYLIISAFDVQALTEAQRNELQYKQTLWQMENIPNAQRGAPGIKQREWTKSEDSNSEYFIKDRVYNSAPGLMIFLTKELVGIERYDGNVFTVSRADLSSADVAYTHKWRHKTDEGLIYNYGYWYTKEEYEVNYYKSLGYMRLKDKWVTPAEFSEFERRQREKGLVKFEEYWVKPELLPYCEEMKKLENDIVARIAVDERREQEANKKAEAISAKKNPKYGVKYKIFQILNDREALCSISYPYEVFNLWSPNVKYYAEDELLTSSLYWGGTYTYTTKGEEVKTINIYSPSKSEALNSIKYEYNLEMPLKDRAGRILETTKMRKRVWLIQDVINGERSMSALNERQSESKPKPGRFAKYAVGNPKAYGSGFFITKSGYLVSNYHVVEDAKSIQVKTSEGTFTAKLIQADKHNDLALLKVEGEFDPLLISQSLPELADGVFAMGFPMPKLQGFSPKVTKGVISSLAGMDDDIRFYQVDAAIQPGNSGGPLINERGSVVGILTSKLNDMFVLKSSESIPQNVNYAVKSMYLEAFLGTVPELSSELPSRSILGGKKLDPSDVQDSLVLIMVY